MSSAPTSPPKTNVASRNDNFIRSSPQKKLHKEGGKGATMIRGEAKAVREFDLCWLLRESDCFGLFCVASAPFFRALMQLCCDAPAPFARLRLLGTNEDRK